MLRNFFKGTLKCNAPSFTFLSGANLSKTSLLKTHISVFFSANIGENGHQGKDSIPKMK